jgi:hypothetical protein
MVLATARPPAPVPRKTLENWHYRARATSFDAVKCGRRSREIRTQLAADRVAGAAERGLNSHSFLRSSGVDRATPSRDLTARLRERS